MPIPYLWSVLLFAAPPAARLSAVRAADPEGRNPDVIVGYAFDETAAIQGARGIIYESMSANRGGHGSFSPVDVGATLMATGPDFRARFVDPLPTANVDVAPTIAWLLGLALPEAER